MGQLSHSPLIWLFLSLIQENLDRRVCACVASPTWAASPREREGGEIDPHPLGLCPLLGGLLRLVRLLRPSAHGLSPPPAVSSRRRAFQRVVPGPSASQGEETGHLASSPLAPRRRPTSRTGADTFPSTRGEGARTEACHTACHLALRTHGRCPRAGNRASRRGQWLARCSGTP